MNKCAYQKSLLLITSFLCCVEQTLANGVLITRLKSMPRALAAKEPGAELQPALKVCITTGLSKKEIERAGITIRHAITKVVNKRK